MHRLQLPALEFGQSPAPPSIATGPDAHGWSSGAVGSSTALEAAWGLVVHAQTLSGVMEAGKHGEFTHKRKIQLYLSVYGDAALRGIEMMQI